jgi:hypothetical protein
MIGYHGRQFLGKPPARGRSGQLLLARAGALLIAVSAGAGADRPDALL